jgi:two-component system, NarL family, response regulator YdfI
VKRVFIAIASSAVVRAGLESLLATSPALTVVGDSSRLSLADERASETLAAQINELRPDVVIAEFEGRAQEELERLFALTSEGEELRATSIVLLTDEYHDLLTNDTVRAGVRAALPLASTGDQIIAAVEAVAAGLFVLHPDSVDALPNSTPSRESTETGVSTSKVDALTEREVEVLGMLAEGLGNKNIAYRLGISEHTVKFHVSSVIAKLGASGRTEAVTIGIRRGLIMI